MIETKPNRQAPERFPRVGLRCGPRLSYSWLVLLPLLILVILVGGCGGQARTRGTEGKYPVSGQSYVINGQRYYILSSSKGYVAEGLASWYGRDFHGRRTASGERYNMNEMTAAHKTLPLQTWVKVTNLNNHREAIVRINDRGPFVRGRLIDMSNAGAKQLDMVGEGTAPVRIQALGSTEQRVIGGRSTPVLVQPESYEEGHFAVQIGSFKNQENAKALAAGLGREFGPARVVTFDRGDAIFYRVQVADEPTLARAEALQDRLERGGFKDCFVVAR